MPHIDIHAPEETFKELVQRAIDEMECRLKILETERKTGTNGTVYTCTDSGNYNSTTSKLITIVNGRITKLG